MAKVFAGPRLRRLRSEAGLSQAELARRLDLSTSYVNQLENDQRPLTVPVLMRLVGQFEVDATYFSGDSDARLLGEVRSALAGIPPGPGRLDETTLADLVGRFPQIARHLVDLSRRAYEDGAVLDRLSAGGSDLREHYAYERVRDYFYAHRNHIPELEVAAETLVSELGVSSDSSASTAAALERHLHARHGVTLVDAPERAGCSSPRRHYDPSARRLELPATLTTGQRAFQCGVQLALLDQGPVLDALVGDSTALDEASRPLARVGLAHYFAGAVLLPYRRFLASATELRYDIDALAQRFGVGFETVAHRLSTLQRDGASGVPFLFVRTDRAGNISKRQSATAFHFSLAGGSCPLWVVHRAFEAPTRVVRQVAEMPDGRRYLWVARVVTGHASRFGDPVPEFAVGLGCAVDHAPRLVYSTGLDLVGAGAATPIGSGCRVCERTDCVQRAFPRSGLDLTVDENRQSRTPYASVETSATEPDQHPTP